MTDSCLTDIYLSISVQINRTSERRGTIFKVFEISSDNGLIGTYALRRARGEGGKPDPKLETLLAHYAQKLQEKQDMAKLESDSSASKPD